MIRPWHCTLVVTATAATILVKDNNSDVLKARLHPRPSHPRAYSASIRSTTIWQESVCYLLPSGDHRS